MTWAWFLNQDSVPVPFQLYPSHLFCCPWIFIFRHVFLNLKCYHNCAISFWLPPYGSWGRLRSEACWNHREQEEIQAGASLGWAGDVEKWTNWRVIKSDKWPVCTRTVEEKVGWINLGMLQEEEIYPCPRPEEQMGNTGQELERGHEEANRERRRLLFFLHVYLIKNIYWPPIDLLYWCIYKRLLLLFSKIVKRKVLCGETRVAGFEGSGSG